MSKDVTQADSDRAAALMDKLPRDWERFMSFATLNRICCEAFRDHRLAAAKAALEDAARLLATQSVACAHAVPQAAEKWRMASASGILRQAALDIRALNQEETP